MDTLSLIGILVTLLIALWQSREASRAKKELSNVLNQLPKSIVENVVQRIQAERVLSSAASSDEANRLVSSNNMTSAQYADLDNDGQDELIIEFPIGAHGSAVQIYKIGFDGAQLVDEWSTDVPYGFDVDTSDPTHSPLLLTGSTNASSGLPYLMGLRDTIWLKLVDGKLVEHRREEPSTEEIEERIREMGEQDAL